MEERIYNVQTLAIEWTKTEQRNQQQEIIEFGDVRGLGNPNKTEFRL